MTFKDLKSKKERKDYCKKYGHSYGEWMEIKYPETVTRVPYGIIGFTPSYKATNSYVTRWVCMCECCEKVKFSYTKPKELIEREEQENMILQRKVSNQQNK